MPSTSWVTKKALASNGWKVAGLRPIYEQDQRYQASAAKTSQVSSCNKGRILTLDICVFVLYSQGMRARHAPDTKSLEPSRRDQHKAALLDS